MSCIFSRGITVWTLKLENLEHNVYHISFLPWYEVQSSGKTADVLQCMVSVLKINELYINCPNQL